MGLATERWATGAWTGNPAAAPPADSRQRRLSDSAQWAPCRPGRAGTMSRMGRGSEGISAEAASSAKFQTTRWSIVLAAAHRSGADSREALSTLCRLYWFPVYAYVRRRGFHHHQAADLAQGFFTSMIEGNTFRNADRERGKFRSYLLGALKHYLSHEWHYANARKRGGGRQLFPLDVDAAEERYATDPSHDLTPEKLYERRWAVTVMEVAMEELRGQFVREGKERFFDLLKEFLTGGSNEAYGAAGAVLGMEAGTVKVTVHRLRKRYADLLRRQIAQTVHEPEQVEEEIRYLFSAVS